MKFTVRVKYTEELEITVNAASEEEAKACANLTLQNTATEFNVMQTWGIYDVESDVAAKVGKIEDHDYADWEILEVL